MTKICILAGNRLEAKNWAHNQGLDDEQWFFPNTLSDLIFKHNFHVIVIGTAGMNTPPDFFERVYQLALERGKIGRL